MNPIRRQGFTLIELLVVIAIMVMMITLGVVSFNAVTGNELQHGAKIVVTACHAAKQTAVSSGLPTAMEIIDSDGDLVAAADESYPDEVRVIPSVLVRDQDTKEYRVNRQYLFSLPLDGNDIQFHKKLPNSVRITYYPEEADCEIFTATSGVIPEEAQIYGLKFNPDGSCQSLKPYDRPLPWTDVGQDPNAIGPPTNVSNFIIVEDQTTFERALIYIFRSTGYVKERYE